MKIGYARVSTRSQTDSLDTQRDQLTRAGCDRVYEDTTSGIRSDRPGLRLALDHVAREGDVLVVTRLDRLGRSTVDTLTTVKDLAERGVTIQALDVSLDTATPAGQLVLTVMAALAQWERELIVERTREGLAAARERGKVAGRPKTLNGDQVQAIKAALDAGMTTRAVAELHGVSARTIRRVRSDEYGQPAPRKGL